MAYNGTLAGVGEGDLEKAREPLQSSRAGKGLAIDAPPWGGA